MTDARGQPWDMASSEVVAAPNCHLHADRAGQNHRIPRGPRSDVQRAERAGGRPHPSHTVLECGWTAPGATYVPIDGRRRRPCRASGCHRDLRAPEPGRPVARSWSTRRRPRPARSVQAVYSREEWLDRPGARRPIGPPRSVARYDASLRRLHVQRRANRVHCSAHCTEAVVRSRGLGASEAACKPSSVPRLAPRRRSSISGRRSPDGSCSRPEGWAAHLSPRRTGVAPSYLALLRVEFAAFHSGPGGPASSLWHWSSPRGGRALPATLRWGARTFLTPAGRPPDARPSGRLAGSRIVGGAVTRAPASRRLGPLPRARSAGHTVPPW